MKILINSYPRSGTTTLVDAIRVSAMSEKLQFGEDFFHNENWISKSHLPVLFLGSFPSDIVIGTILRDPLDAITSNCFRWSNGYTGNIVQGKIVVDKGVQSKEDKFDHVLKNLIEHQVKQFISYYSCLKENASNILMVTYDEVQNDTKFTIDKIVRASGFDTNNLDYVAAEQVIKNPPQPTKEKTELYYQIREYADSLSDITKCYSLYKELLTIKEKTYE